MTTPSSTQLDQIKARLDDLTKRFKVVTGKKGNLSGLLQGKREELATLKKEIEAAGLDPKDLKNKREELRTEVVTLMDTFEKQLEQVEQAFEAFEKK